MNDAVATAFAPFSTQFEGRVEHMYVDVKNYVTIGVGNLIDPIETALPLPFVHKRDPSASASSEEIAADWHAVKGDPDLGTANPLARAGHLACAPLTQLMLTTETIDALVVARASQNSAWLIQTSEFADLDDWPADAQLALHSMAWAMGPAFSPRWPAFRAACAAHDWGGAAANCHMDDTANPGLTPRNVANRTLFRNAAYAEAQDLDLTIVRYTVAGERPTLREGQTGPDLNYLQDRLATLGYLSVPSGSFDSDTADAVRRLQADLQLNADARVGPSTWAATGTCIPAT